MPIYEYEPTDHECVICPGRVEAMQSVGDPPLEWCPHCGLAVKRVVSRASFTTRAGVDHDRAARKGLTTYRRVEKGKWEKIAGEGADMMVGTKEDMEAIEKERRPVRKLDLDAPGP